MDNLKKYNNFCERNRFNNCDDYDVIWYHHIHLSDYVIVNILFHISKKSGRLNELDEDIYNELYRLIQNIQEDINDLHFTKDIDGLKKDMNKANEFIEKHNIANYWYKSDKQVRYPASLPLITFDVLFESEIQNMIHSFINVFYMSCDDMGLFDDDDDVEINNVPNNLINEMIDLSSKTKIKNKQDIIVFFEKLTTLFKQYNILYCDGFFVINNEKK